MVDEGAPLAYCSDMRIIIRVLVTAVALLLVARFVPGVFIDDLYTALIAAVLLGLLNLIVRPILIILTLPITILTFGLFTFVINAALFFFVASFVEGFTVAGFIPALIGSFLVAVVSTIAHSFLKE